MCFVMTGEPEKKWGFGWKMMNRVESDEGIFYETEFHDPDKEPNYLLGEWYEAQDVPSTLRSSAVWNRVRTLEPGFHIFTEPPPVTFWNDVFVRVAYKDAMAKGRCEGLDTVIAKKIKLIREDDELCQQRYKVW